MTCFLALAVASGLLLLDVHEVTSSRSYDNLLVLAVTRCLSPVGARRIRLPGTRCGQMTLPSGAACLALRFISWHLLLPTALGPQLLRYFFLSLCFALRRLLLAPAVARSFPDALPYAQMIITD